MSVADYADLTGIETQVLRTLDAKVPRSARRISFMLTLADDLAAEALQRLYDRGFADVSAEDPRGMVRTHRGDQALEFVGVGPI